jgi:tripartite-type tricarboxylate transporter receptor subunit TctC
MRAFFCSLLVAGALTPGLATAADAVADFPNRQIRVVVDFPPGGTVDTLARIVAQKLDEKWKQPVIVENRPGAGGNIGAAAVYEAPADGYTLLVSPPGPLSINEYLYKEMSFDPAKFSPVALLAIIPNAITARADLPANSVKELIAYAKANPGKVSYASQGNGSTSHLSGQLLASMGGVSLVHVPYRGEGPALNDLLGGRVDLFVGNISAVLKFQETGKIKILAVASNQRSAMAPNIQTSAEAGLPDFLASAWFAVAAPPGTPAPIVEKLNAAIRDALKMPDVRQKFLAQGAEVATSSIAETASFFQAERVRWKKVIVDAGVTLD